MRGSTAAWVLGLLPLALGVLVLARAKSLNAWTFAGNRNWFGWEPGRFLRLYGLIVTTGVGLVLVLLGLSIVVTGEGALGE